MQSLNFHNSIVHIGIRIYYGNRCTTCKPIVMCLEGDSVLLNADDINLRCPIVLTEFHSATMLQCGLNLGRNYRDFLPICGFHDVLSVVADDEGYFLVVNHGGDEFMLILPETSVKGAEHLAEKLLTSVRSLDPESSVTLSLRLSLSIGISGLEAAEDSIDSFIKRADDAMYASKQGGKNRISTVYP